MSVTELPPSGLPSGVGPPLVRGGVRRVGGAAGKTSPVPQRNPVPGPALDTGVYPHLIPGGLRGCLLLWGFGAHLGFAVMSSVGMNEMKWRTFPRGKLQLVFLCCAYKILGCVFAPARGVLCYLALMSGGLGLLEEDADSQGCAGSHHGTPAPPLLWPNQHGCRAQQLCLGL